MQSGLDTLQHVGRQVGLNDDSVVAILGAAEANAERGMDTYKSSPNLAKHYDVTV